MWDSSEWDRLLLLVESGAVIPILGPEISRLGEDKGEAVAKAVGAILGVNVEKLSTETPLNDLALRQIAHAGSAQDIYLELYQYLQRHPLPPSPAQRLLAEISDFKFFVTTGIDFSLEAALREARACEILSLSYAPNDVQDISGGLKALTQPLVYHLLGRLAIGPSYAVTEEDTVEFFHALLSPHRRPERLFAELATSHLLIIGGELSDWLARLFLRASKGERRLSDPRAVREFIVCQKTASDPQLLRFLQEYSKPTRFFAEECAASFAAELHRRWCERNPAKRRRAAARGLQPEATPLPKEMPDRAIFLSYAREDEEAVRSLCAGLQARGLPAWFDIERLEAGDAYERKIRQSIQRCAAFIPVISQNTQARQPRFFKREWSFALDRARDYLPHDPFIVPVTIDDTNEATARVPDRFLEGQWTRLPGGVVTAEFAGQLAKKIEELAGNEA